MEKSNFDHEKYIRMLDFSRLAAGDMVVVDTESGSAYRLSVISSEEDATLATLERRSDHAVVQQGDSHHWERLTQDAPFKLVGSCKSVTRTDDGLVAVDTTEGYFVVGERARLETQIDGEGGMLITSPVQAIQLEKPMSQK